MVFSLLSKKNDRIKIYQSTNRVEQHFQSIIVGNETPVENILDEFDQIQYEVVPEHNPTMLEPLLRFEELSTGIVTSYYAKRILGRLRGGLRQQPKSDEMATYEAAAIKHYEFLVELGMMFYPEIIRDKGIAGQLLNRQFHWLCELTKVNCLLGEPIPATYFEASRELVATGKKMGIDDEAVVPYANLYPEERVTLKRNALRQALTTIFYDCNLPKADTDTALTLWRVVPFKGGSFTDARTLETTHYIEKNDEGLRILRRVYPELDESRVARWFSGLRLAGEMKELASRESALGRLKETTLGGLFPQIHNAKCIERISVFLSLSEARENKRYATSLDTEAFTEIIDCVCFLRRINEDFLIRLSDTDEKKRFNAHEQFEAMNFGYVDGHINQTVRTAANESIARHLTVKMDAEYGNAGMTPRHWHIDDYSATGYGLVVSDGKPPEVGGIVILSKEDDTGIEFAVTRRLRPRDEGGSVVGVETMFAGYEVDPFYIVKYAMPGSRVAGPKLAIPYGFLLTGGPADDPHTVLLMAKRDVFPRGCQLLIRTAEKNVDGRLDGAENEGLNWIAYRFSTLDDFPRAN